MNGSANEVQSRQITKHRSKCQAVEIASSILEVKINYNVQMTIETFGFYSGIGEVVFELKGDKQLGQHKHNIVVRTSVLHGKFNLNICYQV